MPALALAALDTQAGQVALALQRLEALTLAHPESATSALALASLLEGSGDRSDRVTDRVMALLARAARDHPGDPRAHSAYAARLQRKGEWQAAETVLKTAATAIPGNAELLDALSAVQLHEREFEQALVTVNRWLPLQGKALAPLLRLAEAHVGLGAFGPAQMALQRALALQPGSLQAQRGLISLALIERQPQEALARARQVQKQPGGLGPGLLLEGDVLLASGDSRGAAAAYVEGLRRAPTIEIAAKAHALLMGRGDVSGAAGVAADWQRSHPRDADFAFHLGNDALSRGDIAAAERYFQAAVNWQPLHGLALNNLAVAMLKIGHVGALAYAERAAVLMPESAGVKDTLTTARHAQQLTSRVVSLAPSSSPRP
jgi:tetratricopeptide (TPR) repeat protein